MKILLNLLALLMTVFLRAQAADQLSQGVFGYSPRPTH